MSRANEKALLANLKAALPKLVELAARCDDERNYEDTVYRFYHHSFKVYRVQGLTQEIVDALQALLPERPLNEWFTTIVREGTGKVFKREDNQRWLEVTRPMLEAFFHARYFLDMAVRYGERFDEPTTVLPSGWAALLYLYDLR